MKDQKQEVAATDERQDQSTNLMAEIERLKSTNERLLNESKSNKTRSAEMEELRKQNEQFQAAKLEEQGDWQERLKLEQEKRLELQSQLKNRDEKLLKSNVFNAVANVAKDAYDINDLLAQSNASMIEVNEETLEPTRESIDSFVNSLKEQKTYLFKGKKVAAMGDDSPTIATKDAPKPLSKMSAEEQKNYLANSLSGLVGNN